MDGKMRLFPSFSGLLNLMKTGSVKEEDLKDALFYFGCTIGHLRYSPDDAMLNQDVQITFGEDEERAKRVYDAVRNAVHEAVFDERAIFRLRMTRPNFKRLNELLSANGVDTSTVRDLEETEYSFPTLKKGYSHLLNIF